MDSNSSIQTGEEELKTLYRKYDDFIVSHKDIAEKRTLGRSPEGREVVAIVVTDPSVSFERKQVALVTLGRHGNEIGTRPAGTAILNYLAGEEARTIRGNQLVVVVPVANPDGFVRNEFHSSMNGLTSTERDIFGRLYSTFPPDLVVDYHSFGFNVGSRHDRSDMEVIIPANTTRWAMDEQIHQLLALEMKAAAEKEGWPYEIHTLEDLADYYFGGDEPSEQPWKMLKEKMFLLHMQNDLDDLTAAEPCSYTNYTCVPAYLKAHALVFGMELNHWAIPDGKEIGESAVAPLASLLRAGCERASWESHAGYPVNIIVGDFRVSIRPRGGDAAERRKNRIFLWKERKFFNLPQRVSLDRTRTLAKVRYFGDRAPFEVELSLRMRKNSVHSVLVGGKAAAFETFEDGCSTYVRFPIAIRNSGVTEAILEHEAL